MNRNLFTCVALTSLFALASCHAHETREERAERVKQEHAAQKAAIPADSPLAKIDYGMSEGEVESIIGKPTSTDQHTTGKQFIPFNVAAKDTMRLTYYYKGIGRVEFSSGSWGQRNGVIDIQPDTADPGYRKTR